MHDSVENFKNFMTGFLVSGISIIFTSVVYETGNGNPWLEPEYLDGEREKWGNIGFEIGWVLYECQGGEPFNYTWEELTQECRDTLTAYCSEHAFLNRKADYCGGSV